MSPHILAALAFVLSGLSNSCIKALGGELPVSLIMTMRFSISFVLLLLLVTPQAGGMKKAMKTKNLPLHVMRAMFGVIAGACTMYVLPYVPLSEANMLGQTYPFFMMILAAVFLKEKAVLKRYLSCVLGFIGVLLIVQPKGDISILPALMLVFAAFLNAMGDVVVRHMTRNDHEVTIVLWFLFLSSCSSFLWWLMKAPPAHVRPDQWGYLICAGILVAGSQLFLTRAYKQLPASVLAPYSYFGLLMAVVFGFMFFNEIPTLWFVAGGLFIIAGVQWNYLMSKKRGQA